MSRILYITTIDATVYAFLIPHIKALQEEGFEVEVACSKGRFAPFIEDTEIRVHHISFSRNVLTLDHIRAFFELGRLFRERKYDLVHVHTPVAAFLGRLAAKLIGDSRTLYTVHGFHFVEGGSRVKNLVVLILEKLASRWTDALIVMNLEDYRAAQQHKFAVNDGLYFVKGVGVNTEKFNPDLLNLAERGAFKQHLGCEADRIVGMIGEFIPRKRQVDLLLAAESVLREIEGVTFLFIGDGPLLPDMEKLASTKLPEGKFKFLGLRMDVAHLLSIMDVLVLPSLREGLPRSIQEAMAIGKPVVATDVKGNRDLVKSGETGLLVPPKNPRAIAGALLRLLRDKELAIRFGKRAREIAVSELAADEIVKQTVAIQKRILDERGDTSVQ